MSKFPSKRMPKQKLTRQQLALRKINLLKMDILAMLDETTERFDRPYDPISPIKLAINTAIVTLRHTMERSH